jgi:hypothetical protein
MNYSIPANPKEISARRHQRVDAELVATAIAGVIESARSQGQSLDELTAEVLAEDGLLDKGQRRWLSDLVTHAWTKLS